MEKKEKLTEEEIKALIKTVCICKGIRQGRICDAIRRGCDTVEKVNKMTGSGQGGCNATRCRPVIEALIQNKGTPLLNPHQENQEEEDF